MPEIKPLKFTFLHLLLLIVFISGIKAQQQSADSSLNKTGVTTCNYTSIIVPTLLIGYGIAGQEIKALKQFNLNIRDYVINNVNNKVKIDNITQFVPTAAVFGLDLLGVKSKNTLRDQSVIILTSYLIMNAVVFPTKNLTGVLRPDGSAKNSFPSGHTANAFVGAEFLWQEYRDESIWYGVAGYVVATGTGVLRMYNNRHWLTDVAAGAGIGILSTKIAYLINPFIKNKIFKTKDKTVTSFYLAPYYNGKQTGMAISIAF